MICGFLLALSAFSIDITLPLFTQIAADMGVSTSQVAHTVTLYVASMGIGQFFFGPLADRTGRRITLFCGLGLFAVGTVLAFLAPGFSWLLCARVLQGFGGAAAPVVARAILRDLYTGRELARAMAVAMGIFSIGPIVGPLLGGLLALIGGSWRIVFLGMFTYAVILFVALIHMPETLSARRYDALQIRTLLRNLLAVIRLRQSRYYLMIATTIFTSMILIVSLAQPIYAHEFGVTGLAFAILFAIHGFGIIVGQYLNHFFIGQIGEVKTALIASAVTFLATLLIVLFSLLGYLSAAWLTTFIFIFAIGFLAVVSNSISMVMSPHGSIAGFTASFQGAVTQIGGGIGAAVISAIIPLSALWWGLALMLISLVVLGWLARDVFGDSAR